MKKLFLTLLMICYAALCFSYSKPKQDNTISIKGYVNVYGNEPFTFIGIVCDTGEEYSLIADENILQELQKNQGHKIQIKGYKKKSENGETALSINSLKDGIIFVKDWKFVK